MESKEKTPRSWYPEVLVVSGGGLKGLAYVGALTALRDKGVDLQKIKVLCGSSVGALITTGLAVGYTLEELRNEMNDFGDMLPDAIPAIFENIEKKQKLLPLIFDKFSISDGVLWDNRLGSLISKKGFDPNKLTFKRLRKRTKKDLVISGSNITTGQPEYFSYRDTPKMLVIDAVRISSRIPIALPVIRKERSLLVDGDLFDAFPIQGAKKKIRKKARNGDMIGLVLTPQDKSHRVDNFLDYFYRIITGMMIRYNRLTFREYENYLIKLHGGPPGAGLKMTAEDRSYLYNHGYRSGVTYLERRGMPTPTRYDEPQKRSSEDPDQRGKEEQEGHHAEEPPG